jgi:hypothetical protein
MAKARRPQKTARPKRKTKRIQSGIAREVLVQAASQAKYESSPYHRNPKSGKIPVGRRYPAASKCHEKWDVKLAERALRQSICKGLVSDNWKGDFPRKVWYRDGAVVYEAVLSNHHQGTYHGYPLNSPEEWPHGLTR